jgi:hypothetical protein
MKRNDPKTPNRPNTISEQFQELLQLRRKVDAAEKAAASRNGHNRGQPTSNDSTRSAKTLSRSSRKFPG